MRIFRIFDWRIWNTIQTTMESLIVRMLLHACGATIIYKNQVIPYHKFPWYIFDYDEDVVVYIKMKRFGPKLMIIYDRKHETFI